MKLRVAVLLLLYKCLVLAPNVTGLTIATEPAASESTLKIYTDVKQLQDLEIIESEAESQAQTKGIKKEKRDTVPSTRSDFLQYSRRLTLDLNTVSEELLLSEGNRRITDTFPKSQSYPDHPDRFDGLRPQVLCRESVSDQRSYWEVEWSGEFVTISGSYKSICRKGWGNECVFGWNNQSWSLECEPSSFVFSYNKIKTEKLPVKSISSRVGVYVDASEGTLSFYSVSGDTMSLILTARIKITQPLYPGFGVFFGSSVKLV